MALRTRFDRHRNPDDLDAAVAAARDTVTAMPDGHADRARFLGLLGDALKERFDLTGDPDDARAALDAFRRAGTVDRVDELRTALGRPVADD